jgi:drug/metabolite transporter (DMT)-like permease
MLGLAVLLVLGSGFIHAVWNLFTKRSMNKNVFLWCCQLIAIAVFLPWTILELDSVDYTFTTVALVAASMLLHGLYVVLLAAAYSIGDLSQVYPIMRGTSPLLVPLAGVLLLGEKLSPFGWAGVALIVAGILLSSGIKFQRGQGASLKAPLLALSVGLCIAGYIVIDKLALELVPAVVLNEASNVGNVLALSWAAFRSGAIRKEIKVNWKIILLGGILAPGGYLLFLFALSLAPVAQLAPMREIGTVFGTVLGIFILREAQGGRRLIASLTITAGIIVLGLWGRGPS